MTLIQLVYRRGLGYPGAKLLPAMDGTLYSQAHDVQMFSFRRAAKHVGPRSRRRVSGVTRLDLQPGTRRVVLHHLESDSPLAPLLLWDLAHAADLGTEFLVQEGWDGPRFFDRSYFSSGLVHQWRRDGVSAYQKVQALDAEAGSLDEWTFAIPTGPEDATLLNACVARILELDVPRKEILLCGRPSSNFLYWDFVRIVGEDIVAPPVQICAKKNRLVDEASFQNLCILHDRVFLPLEFTAAVQRFGNAFPLVTLQSLYFDDHLNLVPRRYSDFGVGLRLGSHVLHGLARGQEAVPSRYATSVLGKVEATGFVYGNAHRHSPQHYPTGSLYLVKKNVWQQCPLDERLVWAEFEDIDLGERAAKLGIPSRVNPYALTQSMISRPLLAWLGNNKYEKTSGSDEKYCRSWFEASPWLPRKPLIKKTSDQAVKDGLEFMKRWGVIPDGTFEPLSAAMQSSKRRLRWIKQVLSAVQLPLHRPTLVLFLRDVEKLIVGEQVPYDWLDTCADQFARSAHDGRSYLLNNLSAIFNHSAQRPGGRIFARRWLDYLPRFTASLWLGSCISACYLMWRNHGLFVLPGGFVTKLRLILNSTPFRRYALGPIVQRGSITTLRGRAVE